MKSNAIAFFILIGIITSPVYGQKASEKRPNILWIVANDISPDLNCYGNKLVHTPRLDQLASEGVLYKNFITAGAVCSPSRSSFITGMYSVSINCQNQFPKNKTELPAGIAPVTDYFRKAGYYVANTGGTKMTGPHYTGYNFVHEPKQMHDGFDWRGRAKDQPFFAQVHLTYTHRPFKRDPSHPVDPDKIVVPPYYPNHPVARKDWALYLETMQLLDQQVGEILDRLKQDGLAENTIVFFFGDHGQPHVRGKQFLYDGGINAPLIIRWPGHLKPGTKSDRVINNIDLPAASLQAAGITVPKTMQGIDFLDKTSKPRTYAFAARDRCDETLDRIRAVRTKDFKYIRNFFPDRPYTQFNAYKKLEYPVLTLMQVLKSKGELNADQARFMADTRPAEELYDLKKDPFEMHNLAGDQVYNAKLKELRGQMDQWLAQADKGTYPEDAEEVSYAQELMKTKFKTDMEKRGLDPETSNEDYLKYWEKRMAE
ncbi:sulfatase [Dyadobacter sp. CY323]|uniref:sulfatase family protein n=1 Tax=Dyadobacter sp. CY323 TaxID=2907302 RepID=UPI001F44E969|nr:sulfatase [Dyadobacter sp. CY323]MCE6992625.1 sulfatase [Dyadobacter sp. CY323]